ncbi:MCE family protein [Nocardioides sp. WL0053]|jgi:phospholipid/cholesterol/gamma-HCH transport system substrate-binding protein|uniref:MCE family protein n=1 Tax=Nocardioides jiangsuensis TaxID=2866161 RepID=A0ABS7RI61_9ACTN|nr:MCE family protein [Nocardioides jiangsuensis]MBY9074730.1 MCE family protein [Nocardioides jiangsuensis]
MSLLDKRTASDAVKLMVFIVVTTVATSLLVITIGNLSFSAMKEYKAVFSDATGVVNGDDVRIAGVKVGNVEDVEIVDKDKALVTFKVDADSQLARSTQAQIRYRNLVGQRYIALTPGAGSPSLLADGDTIPLEQTTPALDLTVLFNGFKPLFEALSPEDINKLSYEIIAVFQGEGGTLESLLAHTASVTSTLASRDQIIGQLITNLNEVMVTLGDRDDELSSLLIRLREFVSGLSQDREAILGSLDSISELAVETSGLVTGIRKPLAKDVSELRRLTGTLDANKGELDRAIKVLPIKLNKIGATATYGSWFNFYLCNFDGRVKLPGGTTVPVDYSTDSARCDLG